MKAFDIALKDMTRSFRSVFAVVFMFVVPLLVTGMFYFMFGNIASDGEFSLPKTKVVIANLDEGGPKFQVNPKNIPGGKKGAGLLRAKPNIKWEKDRGKEPVRAKAEFPWFWGWDGATQDFAGVGKEPDGNRWNDCHYSNDFKSKAKGA